MRPVIAATFTPNKDNPELDRILVQIMSNSGAVSFITTCLAYKALHSTLGEGSPRLFPHDLLVCDSVPGSRSFWENMSRWSRALALASAEWAPLPVLPMQALWFAFLFTIEGLSWITGWHENQIGRLFAEGVEDTDLMSAAATRLYLYSKKDELVHWEDVEEHVAVAVDQGYRCITERFEESPHVGHMRMYPERYWDAIARAWDSAVGAAQVSYVAVEA